MKLHLNKNYHLRNIESEVVLFDVFSNNTHFLPFPLSWLVARINEKPHTKDNLLSDFFQLHQSLMIDNITTVDISIKFQHFITEAKNSGIIIEKN